MNMMIENKDQANEIYVYVAFSFSFQVILINSFF